MYSHRELPEGAVDRDEYVVCVLEQQYKALNSRSVFGYPSNWWAEHLVVVLACTLTAEGWLYLASWLELATCEVIGYSMADDHRAELVAEALDMP